MVAMDMTMVTNRNAPLEVNYCCFQPIGFKNLQLMWGTVHSVYSFETQLEFTNSLCYCVVKQPGMQKAYIYHQMIFTILSHTNT